ncbi:MAG: hypothetical protein IJX87_01335 [Clostridia bacterium]|nr:hypothetical protein [Clostridia bacterium]
MLTMLLAVFEGLTPMNWETIKPALNFLWQGLLAIFVVIGLIIVSVKIASAIITKAEKAKQERESQAQGGDDGNA